MDFDLTDEQRLIRETAREFTDNEIVPRARENARNNHFDLELVGKIADAGLPRRDRPARVRRRRPRLHHLRARRRGDRPRRLRDAHRRLASRPRSSARSILRWGTEEQKQRYLPRLCSGEWLGCFGLTEPDTGSDAANQRTRAKKVDGGWLINGAKMWISLGNHAKVALIFAQTDPELGHRGLACFLVDTDQPGFQPHEIHGKMGLHGSDTAAIALDDVVVGRRRDARRGRRRLQGRDERARLRPLLRRRRLRRHLPGLRSTSRSPTRRSASSSAARSRASSSCRR